MMNKRWQQFNTVDDYIDSFPQGVQYELRKIREVIKQAAPGAKETIAYRMPAYKLNNRPLVYFAGFKDHISFFPAGSNMDEFKEELASYKRAKGTIRFPLDSPVPYELIAKIVKYRVEENLSKAKK